MLVSEILHKHAHHRDKQQETEEPTSSIFVRSEVTDAVRVLLFAAEPLSPDLCPRRWSHSFSDGGSSTALG